MRIAVDIDVIASALLGGPARHVFFDTSNEFLATAETIRCAKEFCASLSKDIGLPKKFLLETLECIPIKQASPSLYKGFLKEASRFSKKKSGVLALAMKAGCLLSDGKWASGSPVKHVTSRGLLSRYPILIKIE